MRFRKLLCALLVALFTFQAVIFSVARADEGMWPFNNVPRAEIKRKYGFEVTDAWLKKVLMALPTPGMVCKPFAPSSAAIRLSGVGHVSIISAALR